MPEKESDAPKVKSLTTWQSSHPFWQVDETAREKHSKCGALRNWMRSSREGIFGVISQVLILSAAKNLIGSHLV